MAEHILAGERRIGEVGAVEQAIAKRVQRGVALYAEKSADITYLGTGKYRIPSSKGYGSYIVDVEAETCLCADRKGHALGCCKHLSAAFIAEAKRPVLAVQKRHNSITSGYEYFVTERRGTCVRFLDVFPDAGSAYHEKWRLEGAEFGEVA